MSKNTSKTAGKLTAKADQEFNAASVTNLLHNLPGMAYRCLYDDDFTMFFISEGCLATTGYTVAEMQNNVMFSYTSLLDPQDLIEVRKKIDQAVENHTQFVMEYRITKKDGSIAWMWEQGNAIYDQQGKVLYLDGYIAEITDQKKMEFALKNAASEMKELNAAKDRFFSLIAHDLQNPVYAIISLADFLSSNFFNFSSNELLSFVNQINHAAKGIYSLLENLLDWAKVQNGKIHVQDEKISLKRLILNVLEHFRPYYSSKNITLIFNPEVDVSVYLDARLLSSILRNIINNAIKYSYPGTEVEIVLGKELSRAKVMIIDKGIGISRKQMDKLFTLDQGERSMGTNQEPGSGLGLVLVKEFCAMIGGEIKVVSKLNRGSTFTILLPEEREYIK